MLAALPPIFDTRAVISVLYSWVDASAKTSCCLFIIFSSFQFSRKISERELFFRVHSPWFSWLIFSIWHRDGRSDSVVKPIEQATFASSLGVVYTRINSKISFEIEMEEFSCAFSFMYEIQLNGWPIDLRKFSVPSRSPAIVSRSQKTYCDVVFIDFFLVSHRQRRLIIIYYVIFQLQTFLSSFLSRARDSSPRWSTEVVSFFIYWAAAEGRASLCHRGFEHLLVNLSRFTSKWFFMSSTVTMNNSHPRKILLNHRNLFLRACLFNARWLGLLFLCRRTWNLHNASVVSRKNNSPGS